MRVVLWLLIVMVLAGIAYSFSTCRRETSSGQVELTLYDWADSSVMKLQRKRLAIFEKENPDIKVRMVTGGEYKRLAMIAGGVPPDVAAALYTDIPHLAKRNILMTLDKFFADDEDISTDIFFPCAVESVRYRGRIYAIPNTCSSVALIYNKNLFDEYNDRHPDRPLTYPNENWTWDDFRLAAKALTLDRDGDGRADVFGASIRLDPERFPMHVWQNGGEVISKDKKRCLMDSPEAIGAIRLLHEMMWIDKSVPTPYAYTGTKITGGKMSRIFFREQRIAMFLDTRWGYERFKDADFEWDIAPPPKGPVSGVSIYTSDVWLISEKTRYPKQCWRLVKFLVGDKSSEMAMRSGRGVVCNRAVAERMLRHPGTKPEHDYLWIDIINNSRPKDFEFKAGMGGYYEKATNEFHFVSQNLRTPEQACRNYTRIFNEGLKVLWETEGGP